MLFGLHRTARELLPTYFSVIMGGGASLNLGADNDEKDKKKDGRRRNSMAFNIMNFVQYEEDDFAPVIDKIRQTLIEQGQKKEKITKFSKMCDAVARGNNRELKHQVVNFQGINRRYDNQHNNSVLLHFIASEGYEEMLKFMFNPKNHTPADDVPVEIDALNNKSRTPLMMLFVPPTASYLGLRFGVNPEGTPYNETPDGIDTAADWIKPGGPKTRENMIRFLLDKGADLHRPDFHDFTVLHYAAMWGWLPVVKLLVARGADVNGVTITGRTPLMYAIELQHKYVVKYLAEHPDMELNIPDADGQTPLLIAMELGIDGIELMEILIDNGADVNMMNFRKKTPLHIACMNQSAEQAMTLLDKKAQRRPSAFDLLKGMPKDIVFNRIEAEDKSAADAIAALEAERKRMEQEGLAIKHDSGYKNRSPYGQWVDYIDKKDGSTFWYNKVSRMTAREKPKDFVKDRKRIVPERSYGHHFYHD